MSTVTGKHPRTSALPAPAPTPREERVFALWVMLRRATDAMKRVREKELHRYGVTYEQAGVLHAVWGLGEEATPTTISHWLLRTSQSTTEILSRMSQQGLIQKTRDPNNKKRIIVTFTSLGLRKYRAVRGRQTLSDVLSIFSDDELAELHEFIRRFRDRAYEQLGVNLAELPTASLNGRAGPA